MSMKDFAYYMNHQQELRKELIEKVTTYGKSMSAISKEIGINNICLQKICWGPTHKMQSMTVMKIMKWLEI